MTLVEVVVLLFLILDNMASIILKYEALLGGLNNLVEKGETFLIKQSDPRPDSTLLAEYIEEVKGADLYSRPTFFGGILEVGESFQTVNWRVERIA